MEDGYNLKTIEPHTYPLIAMILFIQRLLPLYKRNTTTFLDFRQHYQKHSISFIRKLRFKSSLKSRVGVCPST